MPKHKNFLSKTISTKPREGLNRLMPRQVSQEKFSQNASVAINKLPVEILVAIISFAAGGSRPGNRYPCILFSRVCRYWRSAVLNNATFWKVIVFDQSMIRIRAPGNVLQELLRRSQAAPLEIFVHRGLKSARAFWNGLRADANRVKILHMNYGLAHYFSDVICFFPSLENVFYPAYSATSPVDPKIGTYRQRTNLKALRVPSGISVWLTIPTCFPELQWLDIGYKFSNLITLLASLQNFPNIKFLHLYRSSDQDQAGSLPSITAPIVTLRELKVLILGLSLTPCFINAPNLTYLDIDGYSSRYGINNFCGFNISRITRIRFQCSFNKYCITGYNDSQDTFLFDPGDIRSAYNLIIPSYASRFKLRIEDYDYDDDEENTETPTPFHLFTIYLAQTPNLVEIILDPGRSWNYLNHTELSAFFTAVKATTTVRDFTVTCACSFARLCESLSDGALFPRLEKITWVGSHSETLSDLRPFQELMKERFVTGQKPLIVELPNFPVTSELIEEIEKLGIRLCFTQKNDK
ncbi:hypothetical protein Clacol_000129 [Clathrus columnatus]|uniref:F-box domain-containing protein n=1 Tax=Clathrus columnatus TaxID=1419009 RepID=A0AAV4ZWB4_9AGAM|nr:hypothetical protein Clacol_000129 [Clathrus columnatus]